MRLKKLVLLAAIGVFAFVIAGCGNNNSNGTSNSSVQSTVNKGASAGGGATQSKGSASSGQALTLAADPSGQLKFDKSTLSAKPGSITIKLINQSSVPHDVAVASSNGKTLGVTPEITKSDATLKLKDVKAGNYKYYCTVPGHEQAGMRGVLNVK
jgi:plastocyanin